MSNRKRLARIWCRGRQSFGVAFVVVALEELFQKRVAARIGFMDGMLARRGQHADSALAGLQGTNQRSSDFFLACAFRPLSSCAAVHQNGGIGAEACGLGYLGFSFRINVIDV